MVAAAVFLVVMFLYLPFHFNFLNTSSVNVDAHKVCQSDPYSLSNVLRPLMQLPPLFPHKFFVS